MPYNSENRRIKANDTRQKIYKSAEKLFASYAYHKVSVDEIVKMAGVAKGSFYVHFASKDALIAALISDYVAGLDTDYKDYLASLPDDTPAEATLLSFIGKIADVLIDHIGIGNMQAVYKAQITNDMNMEAVMDYNRDIYKMISSILERGIRRGEFKTDVPVEILTRHFMMAIRGVTYEWCIRYPDFDYKAEAMQHFRLLLDGLRNPVFPDRIDRSGR